MLLMGIALGAVMGFFITYLKVQPFIATLAGMWFARGLCYLISDARSGSTTRLYRLLVGHQDPHPGPRRPGHQDGRLHHDPRSSSRWSCSLAGHVHRAPHPLRPDDLRDGRQQRRERAVGAADGPARGPHEGAGLHAQRLLLGPRRASPTASTSGPVTAAHATGLELTVIAAVVIGGTALTGGEGYVLGALFGVLITALIQSLIQFNGQLSSWWTSIVIGGLMLVFIGVQSLLTDAQHASAAPGATRRRRPSGRRGAATWWRDRRVAVGAAVVVVAVLRSRSSAAQGAARGQRPAPTAAAAASCKPTARTGRGDARSRTARSSCTSATAARAAWTSCTRSTPTAGSSPTTGPRQVDEAARAGRRVAALVGGIDELGWFTDNIYSTSHTPCGQCFTYFTAVTHDGQPRPSRPSTAGRTRRPTTGWCRAG